MKNATSYLLLALCAVAVIGVAAYVAGRQQTNPSPSMENQLQIQDTVVGTGAEAKTGNTVTVNYTGTLENGTVFDSSFSHGQPFSFKLGAGQVIAGWDQGIVGMRVGGKRRLTIPSSLAYGAAGVPGAIPPNATLVFDVQLLKVE